MGLGTNGFTKADLDVMIPEKWPGRINDFYRAGLKAGAFFSDWSEDFADGGDVTHIPNITEMSASTKAINAEVTLVSPTETKIDLTIDTHYHVAFVIEDAVSAQVAKSYKAQEIYARNAAYTVGATLEDALIALFNSFSQTVGDSATALQDSNIRAAIAYLDTANVPEGDRAFFLHPNVIWNQLMGIDKFTLVVNTGGADPVLQGQIGKLYGIPVVGTSRLGTTLGHRNGCLAHKGALAFATANPAGMGGVNKVRLQADYLLEYLGTLVVADLFFGVVEVRDTSGVWIKALS